MCNLQSHKDNLKARVRPGPTGQSDLSLKKGRVEAHAKNLMKETPNQAKAVKAKSAVLVELFIMTTRTCMSALAVATSSVRVDVSIQNPCLINMLSTARTAATVGGITQDKINGSGKMNFRPRRPNSSSLRQDNGHTLDKEMRERFLVKVPFQEPNATRVQW